MRNLVLVGILVLSLALITDLAEAQTAEKLTYVDLGTLFNDYNKTKEYDKVLEKKQKDYEGEREKKVDEVKKLQEKLSLLSEEERESRRSDLEDKISQLQDFDRSAGQDLRKQRDDKVKEIFDDINKAIETFAKKEGLKLIFDKRALVYQEENLDMTDQVLKILNKR